MYNKVRENVLIQFAAGMLLLVVIILLTTQLRPYEDWIVYYIVLLFNMALIVTLLSGVLFYAPSSIQKTSLAVFIVFINLAIVVIMLFFIAQPIVAKIHAFAKLKKFSLFQKKREKVESEVEMEHVRF